MDELRSLREARDAVDDQIQRMQWGLGPCPPPRTPNPATPSVSPQETIVDEMSTRSLFTPASPLLVHTSLSPCPPPPPPPADTPLVLFCTCSSQERRHPSHIPFATIMVQAWTRLCVSLPYAAMPCSRPPPLPHPTWPPRPHSPCLSSLYIRFLWLLGLGTSMLAQLFCLCFCLVPPPPPSPPLLPRPTPSCLCLCSCLMPDVFPKYARVYGVSTGMSPLWSGIAVAVLLQSHLHDPHHPTAAHPSLAPAPAGHTHRAKKRMWSWSSTRKPCTI